MTSPRPAECDPPPSPAPRDVVPGGSVAKGGAALSPAPRAVEELRGALEAVRARIDAAATGAGRDPGEVQLLAVSKTVAPDRLRAAWQAGVRQLAENRVQEARSKWEELADLDIRWTLIGHLQTNKARDAVLVAREIQSLDSLRLAEALDRRLQAAGRGLDVYVQVNSSAEASKSGLAPEEVPDFLAALPAYSSLRVRGLMTIAAHTEDRDRIRECFTLVRDLRDRALQAGTVGEGLLSMGMSADLDLAVECGSTCVRVGRAIFGARPAP